VAYLETWISAKPENILFLYGPKSSGKTTLIYRFIDQNLSKGGYDIQTSLIG
jgi:AAA+ ATPase superfamily predicted ATPase